MRRLDDYRMRLVLVGCVAAVVLGDGSAKADFTFGEPTNLGATVNSSADESGSSISANGLELYFGSYDRLGGYGHYDIWVATRAATEDEWGDPVNLGPTINSSSREGGPDISADGLTLHFSVLDRAGGYGGQDLWAAKRSTTNDPWGDPVNLGPTINSSHSDSSPNMSGDGLELYFHSERPDGSGETDLWVATRATPGDNWGSPVNLGPTINGPSKEKTPEISEDGLALFFQSTQPGGQGSTDLYVTTRETISAPWVAPVNLGPTVNSRVFDTVPALSGDGSTLYFNSDRTGGFGSRDIYQASILPIVDINGDGIVESADMHIMVDHWGENYSLCDIGPMPWGDGIVDFQDLIVLAEHMGGYRHPVARWALDEKEGNVAYDKAGENNAFVYGDATWEPAEGMFGGALQLDGVDDWVFTGPVENLGAGSFSILTWIKGGTPNQVVVSQPLAANWLMVDATGNLMTDVKSFGRNAGPLLSQTIITDGNWHQIALVWDGSHRTLYVDGVPVAEDTPAGLEVSDTGFNFGAGKDYLMATYWLGMLDDVRIYDVALSAEEVAALAR